MSASVEELPPHTAVVPKAARLRRETALDAQTALKTRLQTLLAVPACAFISLAIHYFVPKREVVPPSDYYPILLFILLGLGLIGVAFYPFSESVRKRMRTMFPVLAAAILSLGVWELITTCLELLPLPYFPGPEGVFHSMISDYKVLIDSTWHSLVLLTLGYVVGVTVALVTGVTIGWFPHARYWGMPLLKVIGPIPATAWIPLAMVLSPNTFVSAVGLIALAVWFPVTMLTFSGISSTPASYLDVARTLGASRLYLVFRVAIPAAMPNIFIGLFMGLGTSFLTLVVAEKVGVKSGLGWYVDWAQGWAEYGKVYAALIIMAAFFSTIMTVLFKVRDKILVWQKGTIKW